MSTSVGRHLVYHTRAPVHRDRSFLITRVLTQAHTHGRLHAHAGSVVNARTRTYKPFHTHTRTGNNSCARCWWIRISPALHDPDGSITRDKYFALNRRFVSKARVFDISRVRTPLFRVRLPFFFCTPNTRHRGAPHVHATSTHQNRRTMALKRINKVSFAHFIVLSLTTQRAVSRDARVRSRILQRPRRE